MRKSIGGTSATSAPVHTATTPGAPRAARRSTARSRPNATGERTTRMVSWCGNEMSAANRPAPVRAAGPRGFDPLADQAHGFIWSAAARTALMMF